MQQVLNDIRARAMAKTIAAHINQHEPLLHAEAKGTEVIAAERGPWGSAFRISVESEPKD